MNDSIFTDLEDLARSGDPGAILEGLADALKAQGKLPELFEARLMSVRHGLGLDLLDRRPLHEYPPELRDGFRRGFRETCRQVGAQYLARDDIAGAWPYFRAAEDPGPVAAAIDRWVPGDPPPSPDEWETLIDIAFQQGVSPTRGFDLLLQHHGTCDGITILEGEFPHGLEIRRGCARRLVHHFHSELLRALLAATGLSEPRPVAELLSDHAEAISQKACHVDDSHLQATIRSAATLPDSAEEWRLGRELCEYGKSLKPELQVSEPSPFQDFYTDYEILFATLTGHDVDRGLEHFRQKVDGTFPAEVYVSLLSRVGRAKEALAAFAEHLSDVEEPLRACPSLLDLAAAAGDYTLLRELTRKRGQLFEFAAGLVEETQRSGG